MTAFLISNALKSAFYLEKVEVKMKQFETNKYDEEIKEYENRLREIQKLDMNKEDKTILATFYQNSINNMKTLNDIGVIYG